jgi:hypothetical protein
VIAMKGKNCIALATDLRYGVEMRTVDTNFPKVHSNNPTRSTIVNHFVPFRSSKLVLTCG